MKIAVIIPVLNTSNLLGKTLDSVQRGTRLPDELIVVDDGSSDASASVAQALGAQVLVMPQNLGPAACRNRGVLASTGDIVVFLDADTCVHTDTLERIYAHMEADLELAAVIGSYDDTPTDPGRCSQYRNLAHCYIHHSSNPRALTFWSGCGAVRRAVFVEASGFDERFRRPSIEDIDFGYRISDQGARILLDPEIMVTHAKRWHLRDSIKTDIFDRGIPWMVLLLERHRLPDDLNLRWHHRIAVALTFVSLNCFALAAVEHSSVWLSVALLCTAGALSTDIGLLRFLYRKRGTQLLVVGAALTFTQNICKVVATIGAFTVVFLRLLPGGRIRRGSLHSSILQQQIDQQNGFNDHPRSPISK